MNRCTERLYNGLVKENPTFVLMLGMCPTLAVTTSATNGVGIRDIFSKISRNADFAYFSYVLGFTPSKPGHVECVVVMERTQID